MNLWGELRVTPDTMLAGDSYEIAMEVTAESEFDATGSCVVLDLPATLGYTRPSLYDQEDNGYVAVFCSNPDILYKKHVWDMESGHYAGDGTDSFRGMAQRMIVVDLAQGRVRKGDVLRVVWGYTRNGFGVGTKVSTIVPLPDFTQRIDFRYYRAGNPAFPDYGRDFEGYHRPNPDESGSTLVKILPREPSSIRVFRRPDKTCIAIYDRFYNVCVVEDLPHYVVVDGEALLNGHGVYEVADAKARVSSRGLPLSETPSMTGAYEDYNIYFGDLHSHSSVSNDCTEREKMSLNARDCMLFAKEAACLDFYAVTDHHQPWDEQRNRIQANNWKNLSNAVEELRGSDFVPFAGFEFRSRRGDTAVIFHTAPPYQEVDDPAIREVDDLWSRLSGHDMLTIPHFHLLGELGPDEWIHEPTGRVEPVLEIYSCHGSFETGCAMERGTPINKKRRPDRNGEYFLERGYRYGLVCNSDGHKGNPGCNGLTAVLAKKLTPEAIFEAIRARRVYGTTNARIRLVVTLNGSLMGEELGWTDEKRLMIRLCGENRWKSVDVMHNGRLVRRYRPEKPECEITDQLDECGPGYYYVRATQIDNHIAYSSPIFINKEG